MTRRHVVVALALLSGLAGELLAAVSMTRIAGPVGELGGKLGFPADGALDLRWTLFAVVSVAGWAGAVLWTSPHRRDRRRGAPINVVAATLAGTAVGLDHAVHADPAEHWRTVAFLAGLAIPLFSSVMVHLIAHMTADAPAARRHRTHPALAWLRAVAARIRALRLPHRGTATTPAPPPPPAERDPEVHPDPEPPAEPEPESDDDPEPPAVAPRAWARRWLRSHYRPGMEPAALRTAAEDAGVAMSRQEASRCMAEARDGRIPLLEEVPA